MELNPTSRLRRNEPLMKRPAAVQATTSRAAERLQSTVDRLSLSRQAKTFLETYTRQLQEEAEEAKKREKNGEEDELSRAMKVMKKCQEIAARIMSGGKVPPEDERYLMENDPDGYKLALAARKPAKHSKEYDSVLDEEDRRSGESSEGAAESAGGAEASGEGTSET